MTEPPTLHVTWSPRSRADLVRIRGYIGEFAPLAAQRFTAHLVAAVESLAEQPNRGRPVGDGLRELVAVRPYLVLYEVTTEGVEILHIKHGAQSPD